MIARVIRKPRQTGIALACWMLALLSCGLATPAQAVERQPGGRQESASPTISNAPLRAAIILNIIRFVDFGTGESSEPLLLCVHHSADTIRAIAALDGQRVGRREVGHRAFDGDDASGCAVVYLGLADPTAIARIRRAGLLVIGDGAGFIEAGGTIGLVGTGKHLQFEANAQAARAARIKLSSKLLRLATRVR